LAWLDWGRLQENADLFRFCQKMIQFRKEHPVLRHPEHPGPAAPEVNWHGTQAWRTDWSAGSRVLAFHSIADVDGRMDVIYAAINMHWESLDFELPVPPADGKW